MAYAAALEQLYISIREGKAHAAPLVKPHPRLTAAQQIAIYGDAYRIRLRNAVRDDYPCLLLLLGDTGFDQLADAYIAATHPQSYSLDFYPHGFGAFMSTQTPTPWAASVAELESAMAVTFLGKADAPLTPDNMPALTEENIGTIKFTLRKPYRLLQLSCDAEAALAAFKRGEKLIPPDSIIYLLVHRHNNEVRRRALEPAEYHLLAALDNTNNFADAIDHALQQSDVTEDEFAIGISRWIQHWIGEGYLAALPA